MKNQKVRQLAAIMFADIVGYTSLMENDENIAVKIRSRHREVFEAQHKLHQGKIIQYYGDGALSIFDSAIEGVNCAIAIQKLLRAGSPAVPIRIGLHMGDIVHDNTEVYGDGVNLASRIESLGVSGAVLLSGKINGELKNHKQLSTKSLGHFEFKNISDPVEIFTVLSEDVLIPTSSMLKGKTKKRLKAIAVLPFINMSASADNEYFSDGMTEEIINALAKIKQLRVTSRSSSFFFKNKNIALPEIGRQLKVSTILEGSIRLAGNQMRITAQLVDVADDYHFWSETFDRSVDDIFSVQDEISLLIADKLREHLGHLEIEDHLVEAPGISVKAYKAYLKSRYHMLKMSKPEIDKGISILMEVLDAHPQYALANLGVNLGYTLLATLGFMPAGEAFKKGKTYLENAIKIDEDLPECQIHLSWISFLEKWDFDAAYRHLKKAGETRPFVDYYQSMAATLVAEGKFKAAHNYIDTAFDLDPFSEINHHLKGFIYYGQEKYEKAMLQFDKSIELKPDSQVSILYRGQCLLLLGRPEETLQYFHNLPDHQDELTRAGGIALAYAALGDYKRAREGIGVLEAALQSDSMERAINLLILCRTMMNEHEEALDLINQAVSFRLPMLVYLTIDPMLRPLRSYAGFQELSQKIFGRKDDLEEDEPRKYKKPLLSANLLTKYHQQLIEVMAEEMPYLNPALTLRELADMLQIPPNQLSQLLNKGFKQNFAEFVNSYRLEAFKTKVADSKNQHLTLIAIAYESGFNSKTVFNSFFKKEMGQTPRAYWKSVVG